jgi:hypothetical protein
MLLVAGRNVALKIHRLEYRFVGNVFGDRPDLLVCVVPLVETIRVCRQEKEKVVVGIGSGKNLHSVARGSVGGECIVISVPNQGGVGLQHVVTDLVQHFRARSRGRQFACRSGIQLQTDNLQRNYRGHYHQKDRQSQQQFRHRKRSGGG